MSDARERRLAIGQAIQADGPGLESDDQSILTGWVAVAEWMDETGNKWLSKNNADAAGETLTSWMVNGMLHEALHEAWPTRDEEEEA